MGVPLFGDEQSQLVLDRTLSSRQPNYGERDI